MTAPNPLHQGTVRQPAVFEGPGLHSGGTRKAVVFPAPANHGIVFRVFDPRRGATDIAANWRNARQTPLCTCLAAENGVAVRTVEHLLAACYACGIDNAIVEVHGREIPVLDGSALPFIKGFHSAGLKSLGQPRKRLVIRKKLTVEEGKRRITVAPFPELRVRVRTFVRKIGRSRWRGPLDRAVFAGEIAAARTYGRLEEGLLAKAVTSFWREPLCQGAGLDSSVVVWRGKVLNRGGLRFPDEFARHRVLDLMGDLMLAGADIVGRITARSPVHRLNCRLIETIYDDREAWEMTS
jgi:UDP-3-O-[3-hydroxymyristoyl] N-acetylglucosamine deacetylase